MVLNMAIIDIKLKTYQQLQFEIMKLNTDIFLKNKENKELQERIDKAIKRIEKELSYTPESARKEVGLILVDYKKLLNILKGE